MALCQPQSKISQVLEKYQLIFQDQMIVGHLMSGDAKSVKK